MQVVMKNDMNQNNFFMNMVDFGGWFMVFNATFNNISVTVYRGSQFLLVEETRVLTNFIT